MTKKLLLIGIAPVLALVAFVVMPASAQVKAKAPLVETRAYGTCSPGEPQEHPPCLEGEKGFVAFANKTPVTVLATKTVGSGNLILSSEEGNVECKGQSDVGTVENVAGVGKSTETSSSRGCTTKVGTLACKVNTAGAGAGSIVGTLTTEVQPGGEAVKVTVTGGFNPEFSGAPPSGCPASGTAFGVVTGSATGTVAKGSNVLAATSIKGFKIGSVGVQVTGSIESFTAEGKPVVID